MSTQLPTWKEVHQRIGELARQRGEWAGMPMPADGLSMTVHPSYPFAENFARVFNPEPSTRVCRNEDVTEDCELRNSWHSYRDGKRIAIWREGKKFWSSFDGPVNSAGMLIDTINAARSWDFEAEITAQQTLRTLVTNWAWQSYILTGSFLESSKRSGVIYMFRRLRPTIAFTANPSREGREGVRILCTLCSHPIGFYNGTWAGALVPTDDVISHLLLMRSDEAFFWRISNQHPAWATQSGL